MRKREGTEVAFRSDLAAAAIDGAQPKVHAGAPHGVTDTHQEQLSGIPLAFLNPISGGTADERQRLHA